MAEHFLGYTYNNHHIPAVHEEAAAKAGRAGDEMA